MRKLILFICLTTVSVYANNNWIQINSNSSSGLKMAKPATSFNKPRYKKSTKGQGIRLIDKKLIHSIRQVQDRAKRYR